MKRILLATFLAMGFTSKSQVCFSGLVENYSGNEVQKIEIYRPINSVTQLWHTNPEDAISINPDGSFSKKLDRAPKGTYILKMPDERKISVQITKASDSVFLSCKKDKASFLLTNITGSNGPGNLLFNEERKNIDAGLAPIFASNLAQSDFWEAITRVENESRAKVAALLDQRLVSDSFSVLLNNNMETLILHALYSYTQNLLFSKTRKEEAKQIMDSAYKRYYPLRPAFLQTDRAALINAYKYVRSINEMHVPTSDPKVSKADSNWAALDVSYEIGSQLPEPYREAELADYILINYFYLGNTEAKKAMLLFSKQYPASAYASVFLQAFAGNEPAPHQTSTSPAQASPDPLNPAIHFVSEISSLPALIEKEFKGKFVLVDCWATWCKYCIAEFPYYKNYNDFMRENHIELLFVSFDKPPTDKGWRPMVFSKKIEGNHILANGRLESDILSVAAIKKGAPLPLPRYILIGPDGKVLSNDFDRPSSPEFLNRLRSYVLKYKGDQKVTGSTH